MSPVVRLALPILAGLSLAASPPPKPAPPAWTQGLGMADLEAEIERRIDYSIHERRLTGAAANELRLRLGLLRAREKDWREARTFTADRFNATESALVELAQSLTDIAPKHPARQPPNAVFSEARSYDLDLKGFRLTFEDQFRDLSIGPSGGGTRWFAPVHKDFGEAHFLPNGPGGPFSRARAGVFGDALKVEARKTPSGWTGGLIQTVDESGRGFSQRFGYFEMRAKLPRGPGTWPAFWLLTQPPLVDDSIDRGEIDVLEQYGDEPDRLHMSVHLWPPLGWNAGGLAKHWYQSKKLTLLGLSDDFHRFGVLVTPQVVRFYYDGRALADFPSLPEYRQPLYVLVNLTMHEKGVARATSPQAMLVDYVRVYQLPDSWPPAAR